MKTLVCSLLVCLLASAPALGQDADLGDRQKALYLAGEAFAQVEWNAYFGEKDANREAFATLKSRLAVLGDSKLSAKVSDAEKECVMKGCKSSIPPLNHATKQWTHFQKQAGLGAAFAAMGTAVGTVDFFARYAPKLHPTLRREMTSAAMTVTNEASNACTLAPACPRAVRNAFDQLNAGLSENSLTPNSAEKLIGEIRHQLGTEGAH
jgi:hypothetical protein